MKFTKDNWKSSTINTDSLWIIGPRAKGGKRENNLHGNFVPQIPNDYIQRYTEPDDVVLDMFMGSGTVLYECEELNRRYIGFDIDENAITFVQNKMIDSDRNTFRIINGDICDKLKVHNALTDCLDFYNKTTIDIVFSHPPYMDIIKFTDKKEDLSHITNLDDFRNAYIHSVDNVWPFLKKNGYFILVIGDIYKNGEVLPLGFYLMDAIKKNFDTKMKGVVIKDMVGNRGKIGGEALARFRALRNGYFIFKHEYIFVFKKV